MAKSTKKQNIYFGKLVSILVIGFGTSSVIEILQLITCRGLFEFDDIVHNGLGCMSGVLLISWFCQKNINIHEGEN